MFFKQSVVRVTDLSSEHSIGGVGTDLPHHTQLSHAAAKHHENKAPTPLFFLIKSLLTTSDRPLLRLNYENF